MTLSNQELHANAHPGQEADLAPILEQIAAHLQARGWMLATAESCTGGMIAAACTERAGSSQWFERGFVSYSNAAKSELLGVPAALIATQGAVSQAVACAMAEGAIAHSQAQVSLAVTGIAGPGGASADKPVGSVWLAWCLAGQTRSEWQRFPGDRAAVRAATRAHALHRLAQWLAQPAPEAQPRPPTTP